MRSLNHSSLSRGSGMWLLTFGLSAGAVLCGRLGWLPALLGGLGGLVLYEVFLCLPERQTPGLFRLLQLLWLVVPLGLFAATARDLFPDASNGFYVPAVVLALSWLLSRHPRDGVLACAAIAGFFLLTAVGVVLVFALPNLQLAWLRPSFDWVELLLAFAISAGGMLCAAALPGVRPGLPWRWAALLAPAAISAVVVGSLSAALAARQAAAFYTLSRSISLFGVVERFEALVASCLTLGLCSSGALVLRAARQLVPTKGGDAVGAALCLTALFGSFLDAGALFLGIGSVLLWVLLPLLTRFLKKEKKVEKSVDKQEPM